MLVVIPLPYAALWLLISTRLPRRGSTWHALIPGALLLGLFLMNRLVVATAVVNATLWARRSHAG